MPGLRSSGTKEKHGQPPQHHLMVTALLQFIGLLSAISPLALLKLEAIFPETRFVQVRAQKQAGLRFRRFAQFS